METFLRASATLFGLGLKTRAPGTVASLVTLPFAYLVSLGGPVFHMVFTVLLMIYGIFACESYEQKAGTHDLGEVVLDESIGILIATIWLPPSFATWILAFALFRLFDILKPFPISWLDEKIPGGVGVVADDVAAGVVSSILLQWLLQSHFLPAIFYS